MPSKRLISLGLLILGIAAVAGWLLKILPGESSPPLPPVQHINVSVNNKVAEAVQRSYRYSLDIEKLALKAVPIVTDVDGGDPRVYLKALQNGVAQMQGTAKPDEPGNIVLFGHSSADPARYKGKYGIVFSALNKLVKGDAITITDQTTKERQNYTVAGKKIVPPSDTELIQQNFDARLTLVTCWPVGSDTSRLVVWATRK